MSDDVTEAYAAFYERALAEGLTLTRESCASVLASLRSARTEVAALRAELASAERMDALIRLDAERTSHEATKRNHAALVAMHDRLTTGIRGIIAGMVAMPTAVYLGRFIAEGLTVALATAAKGGGQ